jgi:hypothetical protein
MGYFALAAISYFFNDFISDNIFFLRGFHLIIINIYAV